MVKIKIKNNKHIDVLKTLATIANKTSEYNNDTLTIHETNRVHSSKVTKRKIEHETPIQMRCLGVPGKAFFIKSNGKISVTGNTKHLEGISWLFNTICEEHPRIVTDKFKREIYDMNRKVVELEDQFVELVFANHTIEGLDKEEIKKYIRYIADRRLIQLGLKGTHGVKENPLTWLDWIMGATTHTNFFESKSAEYEVGGLQGNSWGYGDEPEEIETRKFIIYSKDGCPFCIKAKDLLTSSGHEYEEINLNDDTLRNKFYDDNNFEERSVPKIYEVIDEENKFIGGYTQLRGHIRDN